MPSKMTFEESAIEFLLKATGYSMDSDGFIINQKTGKRILATDGKIIKAAELAAITKKGVFRKGIVSLIELHDYLNPSPSA